MNISKIYRVCRQLGLLAVCGLIVIYSLMIPVYAESTGSCGNGVSWNLSNGILKISGNGKMTDFSDSSPAPWFENRDDIVNVIIENDVDHIGSAAFYDCNNLGSVIIGNDVESIGSYAFLECEKLTNVRLGSNVKSIGQAAFKMCMSLQNIILPSGLTSIGHESFFYCQSLTSITIPSSVTYLGECVFSYCSSLLQVIVNANLKKLPDWTFYECDSLVNITLPESLADIGADVFHGCDHLDNIGGNLSSDILEDIVNQTNTSIKNEESNNESTVLLPNQNDTLQEEVVDNEDVLINGSISNKDIIINAEIKKESGWENLLDKVDSYLNVQDALEYEKAMELVITVENNQKIDGTILENLAGTSTKLLIKGENIEFEIDCKQLVIGKKYKDFKLDYTLEKIEKPTNAVKKTIGEADGFYLKFKSNIDFNVTVKILVGPEYSQSIAAFYQKDGNSWDLLQSVIVSNNGYASFYLSNFDTFTKYMIGINVDGVMGGILPDDEYDGLIDAYGNRYVITGSESKWGISVGQVTLILIAVMLGVTVVIGGAMFVIVKRKQTKEKIRQEVMGEKK